MKRIRVLCFIISILSLFFLASCNSDSKIFQYYMGYNFEINEDNESYTIKVGIIEANLNREKYDCIYRLYPKDNDEVIIPSVHNNLPVTKIERLIPYDEESVYPTETLFDRLVISDGIKEIGSNVFESHRFRELSLPSSLEYIGEEAFQYCSVRKVILPDNLKVINDRAFYGCNLRKVQFGNQLQEIRDQAFNGCAGLDNVYLPDGLKIIGDGAFGNCEWLTNISIPDSLEWIGKDVFYNCLKMKYQKIDNVNYIGNEINPYVVCLGGSNSVNSYTINSGCKVIEGNAFSNKELTSITLPNGLRSLGDHSFSNCKNLNTISIPSSVYKIGKEAFMDCENLISVNLPNELKELGDAAFSGASLNEVIIPTSLDILPAKTFEDCNLTSVTIPGNIKEIGWQAFKNNENLSEVTINEGVKKIGSGAFNYCNKLKIVSFPSTVEELDDTFYHHCYCSVEEISIYDNYKKVINLPDYINKLIIVSNTDGSKTEINQRIYSNCYNYFVPIGTEKSDMEYFIKMKFYSNWGFDILFNGTKEDWTKLYKSYFKTKTYSVYCIDGELQVEREE